MINTKPGLAFPIYLLSQYLDKVPKERINTILRIFKDFKYTIDYTFNFTKKDVFKLTGYSNEIFSGDSYDRKSINDYGLLYGRDHILWRSKTPY